VALDCGLIYLLLSQSLLLLQMSFLDPWGDIVEECNADSFVDDTSLGCNDTNWKQ
jgi:hypothetical protein